ncbi:tRNA lysidine(34) synthetase TilS [Anaerosphaera multitolerans]|uniref:tRNA(Ile)-lysidine synthase n=1 Tax=Anaerosphaera multitolerans TaxID=2487351 RepID=A0A437S6D6_9FIRM|nr:tRNA lysidine(34) synthetase TilS [Anaerosphaera multitolerans]RVU54565.1 tRNA lysidine(34) synthetase TilS [Anaerosphaera multitolerans]
MYVDNKFLDNIEQFNMLKYNDKVIACVSGGADSIYLLYNLYAVRERYNLTILVAHVNHGVRETSKRDEEFVLNLAKSLGLESKHIRVNMNEYAKDHKLSSEEAGRNLRYKFFRELSKEHGKIFLAHNANDQAETVLLRIIRGTGIEGLSSMGFISDDLYRPMLNIKRTEIMDYISKNEITYVEDETNSEEIYARNKIRLKVIPYIEENFNPGFINSLLRLSEISTENYLYVKSKVDEYIFENYRNGILDVEKLRDEREYFISEVIREYLRRETGSIEGISKLNIFELVLMVKTTTSSRLTLPKNVNVELSYNSLYIKRENDILIGLIELREGINETPLGRFKIVKNSSYRVSDNMISIDQDKVRGKLYLRNKRDGDRFIPFGMKNNKKLKDFFIDEKIDRSKRNLVPIICDDENIIWVCPYRLSEMYCVDRQTKKIMNIILEERDEGN